MKTLKQLHDEQDNIPKIHAQVEGELKKIPGVIAVDIGFKQKAGETTETISFIVYVQQKKDEKDLQPEHIIPKIIQGIPTDVVLIASSGKTAATLPDSTKYRPLKGGVQISNGIKDNAGQYEVGTLGCFATLNSDNSVVGLSNFHVMFAKGAHGETGGSHNGSKMGQPEYYESCCCDCDLIGTIITGLRDGVIDGAICTINSDITKVNEIEEIGVVAGAAPTVNVGGINTTVRAGDPVKKRGRTSGLTTGTVMSINYALNVDGTLFTGLIRVTPDNPAIKFQDHGDSGAVLVNSSNQVCALLFAAPFVSGTTNLDGTGVGSKIFEVTSRLHISISSGAFPPGGGSSSATLTRTMLNISPPPAAQEQSVSMAMQDFESRLNNTSYGKILIQMYYKHRNEIRDLINSYRPATVAWNRNQGPAFIRSMVKSIRNPGLKIEKQINGVTLDTLLTSMKSIFSKHGSTNLTQDINLYGTLMMKLILLSDSAESAVEIIKSYREE